MIRRIFSAAASIIDRARGLVRVPKFIERVTISERNSSRRGESRALRVGSCSICHGEHIGGMMKRLSYANYGAE